MIEASALITANPEELERVAGLRAIRIA
jgi:hypothetical protein